jgi:hypothetical protein
MATVVQPQQQQRNSFMDSLTAFSQLSNANRQLSLAQKDLQFRTLNLEQQIKENELNRELEWHRLGLLEKGQEFEKDKLGIEEDKLGLEEKKYTESQRQFDKAMELEKDKLSIEGPYKKALTDRTDAEAKGLEYELSSKKESAETAKRLKLGDRPESVFEANIMGEFSKQYIENTGKEIANEIGKLSLYKERAAQLAKIKTDLSKEETEYLKNIAGQANTVMDSIQRFSDVTRQHDFSKDPDALMIASYPLRQILEKLGFSNEEALNFAESLDKNKTLSMGDHVDLLIMNLNPTERNVLAWSVLSRELGMDKEGYTVDNFKAQFSQDPAKYMNMYATLVDKDVEDVQPHEALQYYMKAFEGNFGDVVDPGKFFVKLFMSTAKKDITGKE